MRYKTRAMFKNSTTKPEATPTEVIRSNPPKNLNLREAAAYLCVSDRKLRYMIAEGEIRAVRFGRRIILRLKDLDEALDQNAY